MGFIWKDVVRPLFSRRVYSAPRKRVWYTSITVYLCQSPSGMLGVNCLPIKHRCLYILFDRFYYRSRDMYTTTSSASKEAVIEYAVCEYKV